MTCVTDNLSFTVAPLQDIAGLCLFLSGRAGAWVTGAVIPLEGGVLAKAKL
jgi:hypothetical protein